MTDSLDSQELQWISSTTFCRNAFKDSVSIYANAFIFMSMSGFVKTAQYVLAYVAFPHVSSQGRRYQLLRRVRFECLCPLFTAENLSKLPFILGNEGLYNLVLLDFITRSVIIFICRNYYRFYRSSWHAIKAFYATHLRVCSLMSISDSKVTSNGAICRNSLCPYYKIGISSIYKVLASWTFQ